MAFVWLIVGILWLRQKDNFVAFRTILIMGLITLPGIFWILRNLWIMGSIYSSDLDILVQGSILYNLDNPNLYILNFSTAILLGVLGIFLLGLLFSWKKPSFRTIILLFGVLIGSFVITPVSAFHELFINVPPSIAWRFGLYVLAFTLIIGFIILDQTISTVVQTRLSTFVAALLIALNIAIVGQIGITELFKTYPENRFNLREYWLDTESQSPTQEIYAYVHTNINNSVVQFMGATTVLSP